MAIVEISFRHVDKTGALENLIREKARKLREIGEDLMSCRVAVECPQQHQRRGNPYRVRIELGVRGKELVTVRESSQGDMHDPLPKVIRDTFNAARRQLVVAGILIARNRRENRLRNQEMSKLDGRLQFLKRLNAEGEASQEEFSQEKKDQG